ncbi:hypothetical protein ACWDZ4_18245 [Streptomyces sp. NPDC003016]
MLRITAAAKAMLLALFALLSLTAATGDAVAASAAGSSAAAAGPETAPPVLVGGSCSAPLPDTETHPGHARRAHRPETGGPQPAVRTVCALSSPPAELPLRTAVAVAVPYCHAPFRSGDFPVALQVFRC